MTTTTVLVVNDIHMGSNEAIMPGAIRIVPDNDSSILIKPSGLQKFYFKEWRKMLKRVGPVDVCIANGDLVEGINRAEGGAGNWTNELDVQVDEAARLLKMIGAKQYYGTQGSPYHTGLNTSCDKLVLDKLDGIFKTDLYLTVNGIRFHCRHDIGYSGVPHGRATAPNRDLINTKLNSDLYGNVDISLYAHTHYSQGVMNYGQKAFIVPGWKARDGFVRRKSSNAFDNGYGLFRIDDDGYYTYDIYSFRPPQKYVIDDFTYIEEK